MAERHVQTVKKEVKKAMLAGKDPHQYVLELCVTPIINGKSPSQILMNRSLKSKVPRLDKSDSSHLEVKRELINRQNRQKLDHDKTAKPQKPLEPGPAYVRVEGSKTPWQPVRIIKPAKGPRSYVIQTESGRELDRAQQHLQQRRRYATKNPSHQTHTSVLYLQDEDLHNEDRRQEHNDDHGNATSSPGPSSSQSSSTSASPSSSSSNSSSGSSSTTSPQSSTTGSYNSLSSSPVQSSPKGRGRGRGLFSTKGREIKPPGYLKDYVPK